MYIRCRYFIYFAFTKKEKNRKEIVKGKKATASKKVAASKLSIGKVEFVSLMWKEIFTFLWNMGIEMRCDRNETCRFFLCNFNFDVM